MLITATDIQKYKDMEIWALNNLIRRKNGNPITLHEDGTIEYVPFDDGTPWRFPSALATYWYMAGRDRIIPEPMQKQPDKLNIR